MKTVHFFAFYPHNLPKITDFSPWTSMNLKNTKSLHFDGVDGSSLPRFQFSDVQSVLFRFPPPHLWDFTPAFTMIYSCFYDDLLLILWWFTPDFMMIYSCFYDEVVQYSLNRHGYSFEFVSDVDCNTSLPRIQNFQARKIIVSCRENFMLNTRMHFILYENTLNSRKECSWFSYRA